MSAPAFAKRYAQSLLDLVGNTADAARADFALISSTIRSNKELALALESPVVKQDAKARILTSLFGAHCQASTLQFLNLAVHKGRGGQLLAIAQAYVELYNEQKGIVIAQVRSAKPLTAADRTKISEALQPLSKHIELVETTDARLLGGLKITVGDRQIDATLRRKLNQLKTSSKGTSLSSH